MPDLSVLSGDDISAAQDSLHSLFAANAESDSKSALAEAAVNAAAVAKSAADAAGTAAVAAIQNIFDKVTGDDETIVYQGQVVTIEGGKVVLTPAVVLQ